jgi:hypothetical protein
MGMISARLFGAPLEIIMLQSYEFYFGIASEVLVELVIA